MFKTRKPKTATEQSGERYTSLDVSRVSGVSLRQLQWWDEQGVVSPSHSGHKRLYAAEEVIEVAVIAELRRKGFSLQKIRRVLKYLQKEMGKRLFESVKNGAEAHLLTDGKNIYLEDNDRRIVNILKSARQPMISVCVSDQIKRLTASLALPPKKVGRETAATRVRQARAAG
ncbi:MAG: MerR family transcriptional regulator [Acidobacteria bacterium]|nr:MerR family transcriptional regulator [Acidobacteriota bacterium]